jgi:hypothetical protein
MFRHDCHLAVKSARTTRRLVHKKTWRYSPPIDTLLSAVSFLVVAQPSSEFPEGLTNYSVCTTDVYVSPPDSIKFFHPVLICYMNSTLPLTLFTLVLSDSEVLQE